MSPSSRHAKLSRTCLGILWSAALALPLIGNTACSGAVRYDLPGLLGEYVYDGPNYTKKQVRVDAPFDPYLPANIPFDIPFDVLAEWTVDLVVVGTGTAGRAHGDGTLRQAVEFDLRSGIESQVSLVGGSGFGGGQPFEDSFRMELRVASSLFQSGPICLCDVPSLSLDVSFAVTPDLVTLASLPPVIDSETHVLNTEGYIVDIPIVGHITEAYLVLEGPGFVPEPRSWLLFVCGTVALVVAHARRCRSARPIQ